MRPPLLAVTVSMALAAACGSGPDEQYLGEYKLMDGSTRTSWNGPLFDDCPSSVCGYDRDLGRSRLRVAVNGQIVDVTYDIGDWTIYRTTRAPSDLLIDIDGLPQLHATLNKADGTYRIDDQAIAVRQFNDSLFSEPVTAPLSEGTAVFSNTIGVPQVEVTMRLGGLGRYVGVAIK